VHEAQSNGVLHLEPVGSADNVADLLTKRHCLGPLSCHGGNASWASKSDSCSDSYTVSPSVSVYIYRRKPRDEVRVEFMF
jgi:hypothetical protein